MGIVGVDRHLPAKPRPRLATERLQRHRQQSGGDLFAAGDHHIVFGGIIKRVGLAAKADQAVSLARHGRDDHGHFVPGRLLAPHDPSDTADPFGPCHRSAAKFHHDPGHAASYPLRKNIADRTPRSVAGPLLRSVHG